MIIQIISSFIAILFFSILFNVPKSELLYCGFTGSVGWSIYYICNSYMTLPNVTSTFFSIIVVAILSRILAVKRKMPLTIFIAAGTLPTVPGAGIYNTMYMIITNNSKLTLEKGIETINVAGVIAIGIFLILALPDKLFTIFKSKELN